MKNYYNEVVKIINHKQVPEETKKFGRMILRQYNTAAGPFYLKHSLKRFFEDNEWHLKEGLK